MTDNTQAEALDLADWLEAVGGGPSAKRCAALLREQHARIADLEAQLAAIGAGGVTGPLIGQPQAMPDLSQLTERGAVAWAGVDAQELREGFTAADMATAESRGFRDGAASLAASAGEPRDLNPRHIRKFLQALQAGEMSVSRAVEILDAWVDGYYKDEMVPPPPPDSCLIADDEFPMEIVRKLRSELAAAPPTAQAGGWKDGIEAVAKMLEKKADDFAQQHGYEDMGSLSFGRGPHADAKLDHHSLLCELAEEVRGLTTPTSAEGVEHADQA